MEQLMDARLRLGRHAEIVADLTALTREYPLRERFWAQLMLALYRCGRQAEALQAYRTVSGLLAEELGIDPGEDLQRVHQSLLTADVRLAPAHPSETVPAAPWIAQCQLPLDVGDFAGRTDLIHDLEELLSADNTVPVVTLSGAPGVGKTALAVRVAHRLRSVFPDGQWYVRLGGAGHNPRDPADLLAELLRTSGVDGAAIPEALNARAATLRSRLANRRLLLVLDDAGSADQVRPLLPGVAGSAVLITSRHDLSRLTVLEGGRSVHLGVLHLDEANALLLRILNPRAIRADPAAVAELVKLCGSLPLALRIAAANLIDRPGKSLTSYVAELRTGNRLAKLAVTSDPQIAVRAAFNLSYTALDSELQRLFRLLGVIPGAEFTPGVAAALLDTIPADAEQLLDRLATANLIERHATDRYRFHDLLHLYAAECADGDPERDTAWRRLCDWYLTTADAAVQYEYLPLVRLPRPPVHSNLHGSADKAREWLDAERANLAAVAVRAADAGPSQIAWHLADVLRRYFYFRVYLAEWRACTEAGLRAARAAGDQLAEGAMLQGLGSLHRALGDPRAALVHNRAALALYREVGFGVGQAALLCNLATVHSDLGEPRQAADLLSRGLALFRELRMSDQIDMALINLSQAQLQLGELAGAIRSATECLALGQDDAKRRAALSNRGEAYRLMGSEYDKALADLVEATHVDSPRHEASPHFQLALLYADTGQLGRALQHATRALRASKALGATRDEAESLNALGEVHRLCGQPVQAAAHHDDALRIASDNGYRALAAEAHLGLAQTWYDAGDSSAARHHARQALAVAQKLELRISECRALLALVAISRDLGEMSEASQFAERARQIQDETGYGPPSRRAQVAAPLAASTS